MNMHRLFSMQRSSTAKKILLVTFLAVFLCLLLPQFVLAQDDTFGVNDAASTGLPQQTDLKLVISNIVRVILGFLGIIAVIIIMYGGFIWMTAGGDPTKVEKAKKILINAVIGLIIILTAFIIVSFIIRAFQGEPTDRGPGHPGGPGDLGRWGIGVGPIESVYPRPGQIDVPINTSVVVTFKELIDPATICDTTGDSCTGNLVRNVEICQLNDLNICVDEDDDDTNDQFGTQTFMNSVVTSLDNKTFVFLPNTYLGLEDFQNRKFKVTLLSGIETRAEPGRSVFNMLVGNEFAWDFTTNGELDLDPPEVIDLSGVYPYPDDDRDDYDVSTPPTSREFTFSLTGSVVDINQQVSASYTQPANSPSTSISASLSGVYGGTATGAVTVTIDSGTGIPSSSWPDGTTVVDNDYIEGQSSNIYIGPYGLSFNLNGFPDRGNSWTFDVEAYEEGDRLLVKENDVVLNEYTFGTGSGEIEVDDLSRSNTLDNIVSMVANNNAEFISCGDACVKTVSTGNLAQNFTIDFVGQDNSSAITIASSGGDLAGNERSINGLFDAYRNSVIQINFNEAINPISIQSVVVIYDSDNDSDIDGDDLVLSDIRYEISNQYRTIEVLPSEANICGVNSCGDSIYCWPMYNGIGDTVDSTLYEVQIIASSLMLSDDNRCGQWQGASAGDGSNRCLKEVGDDDIFYPAVGSTIDGIIDMSLNSFNGSSDEYLDNNRNQGMAQGQSGTGDGHSGRSAYLLNSGLIMDGDTLVTYGESTPVYGISGFGDNFTWSTWISSEIDSQAPLAKTIFPRGNDEITDPTQDVETAFDRLMRSHYLRPGWNYGDTEKSKSQRYVVLDTISQQANPVGYWISKIDNDDDGNGWADYTISYTEHHDFDDYVQYGPGGGSGIQSITQNCFLPAGGPQNADARECIYTSNDETFGCVRDTSLGDSQVELPNPSSYGFLNCNQINGASECGNPDNTCKVFYYDNSNVGSDLPGSWIISQDYNIATDNAYEVGRTDCCFGVCVSIVNPNNCDEIAGANVCDDTQVCKDGNYNADEPSTDFPGRWIMSNDYQVLPSGDTGPGCCAGVCVIE